MALFRVFVILVLVFPLTGISTFETLLVPRKEYWARWDDYQSSSLAVIDHSEWDGLLKRYVEKRAKGPNLVAYGRVSSADKALLEGYLAMLSSIPIGRYGRNEQRAYWINLYNALTVKVVLDHYPVETIRDIDISPGLFADGPWGKKLSTVEGEQLSLNDVEHRILRPVWDDARIHYGLNCASVGCPSLLDSAFTGENSDALLDKGAIDYINSDRGTWETEDGLAVSSIYAWFPEDFGGDDKGILEHLRRYAGPDLKQRLEGLLEIADHGYDWRLNDAAAP